MNTFTIILIVCGAILIAGYIVLKKFVGSASATEEEHHHGGEDGVCCGRHTVCSHGYETVNLYFDDEELDRFKERTKESYTDEEIEEFRNVLYTMQQNEVETWTNCLQKRGIELPEQIKDEILLMLQ